LFGDVKVYKITSALIIIIGVGLLFQLFLFGDSLSKVEDRMVNLDNGLNYLYTHVANDLSTSFEDRNGLFPVGSYNGETGNLILVTKNLGERKTCLVFLHELGHKRCYPDLTEECANVFREENLWRCNNV